MKKILQGFFFFFLILQLKQRLSTSGNFQNECSNSQRWFLKSILMYTKTKRKQFSNKSNFQNGVLTLNQSDEFYAHLTFNHIFHFIILLKISGTDDIWSSQLKVNPVADLCFWKNIIFQVMQHRNEHQQIHYSKISFVFDNLYLSVH